MTVLKLLIFNPNLFKGEKQDAPLELFYCYRQRKTQESIILHAIFDFGNNS